MPIGATLVSFMIRPLSDPNRLDYSAISPESLCPSLAQVPESSFSYSTGEEEEWTRDFISSIHESSMPRQLISKSPIMTLNHTTNKGSMYSDKPLDYRISKYRK